MSDHRHLTVRALRELAREHLGRGHSRLKTKDELIAALKKVVPDLFRRREASETASRVAKERVESSARIVQEAKAEAVSKPTVQPERATRAPTPVQPEPRRAAPESKAQALREPREQPSHTAFHGPAGSADPSSERSDRSERDAGVRDTAPAASEAPVQPAVAPEPEPVVEGFFVVRSGGPRPRRRAPAGPLRATPGPAYQEALGELPPLYGDQTAVALPRDPTTLFFFWDFHASAHHAAQGMRTPHVALRLFEGDRPVREVKVALATRTHYFRDLTPGKTYRVEAFLRDVEGPAAFEVSSNHVTLPAPGPSADLRVRMMHVPWYAALGRGVEVPADEGAPLSVGEHLELPSSHTTPARPGERAPERASSPGRWHPRSW